MDLNKLITKRINEYALNSDANLLDQYGFLITMIAKEYAAEELILSSVLVNEANYCEDCKKPIRMVNNTLQLLCECQSSEVSF